MTEGPLLTGDPDSQDGDRLSGHRVSQARFGRAVYITSTGVLLLVVGLVGNLVLARLLTPRDFGLIALGATVITLATVLADGGLAAAFIRRGGDPGLTELRSLMGIQLAIT